MGMQKMVISDPRRNWRGALFVGIGASIISLMLGLLFQTVFYEIARNVPFVFRQDSHVSLPLCNIFPDMYGCEAWVGLLTGLELWKLSLQVGQISGLCLNLVLIAIFSMLVTVRSLDSMSL